MGLTFMLGSPLMTSWMNMMLWAVELQQATRLWDALPDAKWRVRVLATLVVLADTAGMLVACAQIWLVQGNACVALAFAESGLPDAALDPGVFKLQWTYPVIIAMTGVSALVAHAVLLRRLWILSQNHLVVLPLAGASIVALVGAVVTSVDIFRFPRLMQGNLYAVPAGVWVIASVCTDSLLAVALLHFTRQQRPSAVDAYTFPRRWMPRAVETGVTTAVLFLAVCLLLVSPMLAEISVALELVAGRLYGVTVLYNLQLSACAQRSRSRSRSMGDVPPGHSLSEIRFKRPDASARDRSGSGLGGLSGAETDWPDTKVVGLVQSPARAGASESSEYPRHASSAARAEPAV